MQLATIAGYIDTEVQAIIDAIAALHNITAAQVKTAMEAEGSNLDELHDLIADNKIAAQVKGLDDGVLTAGKYDESTAFPVSSEMKMAGGTIVKGTVSHDNTAATTTVFYSDDITEATADHFNGRIVIFTSGALQYQATDITDYELVAGEGKFTVTALTEAPADNITFVIV